MTGPATSEPARRRTRQALGWGFALPVAVAATGFSFGAAASLNVASGKLTVLRTCVLSANSALSTVGGDASVREGNDAGTNYGAANTANVTVDSNHRRTYLRFELAKCSPAIPPTATVRSATVRLFVTNLPSTCRTHDIFPVPASWSESLITWNNQPFGTGLNQPLTAPTSSISLGSAGCQNQTTKSYVSGWTVTGDVQAFVGGAATNFGWMIRDHAEDATTNQVTAYSTREKSLASVADSPQLIVSYR